MSTVCLSVCLGSAYDVGEMTLRNPTSYRVHLHLAAGIVSPGRTNRTGRL